MKLRSLFVGAVTVALMFSTPHWSCMPRAHAQSADCGCDDDDDDDDDDTTNDPAFIMSNKTANIAAIQQQAILRADQQSLKKPAELVAAEQAHYQAYMDAVKKTPANAFQEAVAVWKRNDSADLQRLVIIKALSLVKSPEQIDALQFMLKALDAPETQRKECARLGRGNSLEKSIAVKQLALLESNPKLRRLQVNN